MTRYINSDYNNYVPPNTAASTLHTGAGKVHAIVVTADSSGQSLILYDNTAASGNVLITLYLNANHPIIIIYPDHRPLTFSAGLTAVTTANCAAHLVTEA